MQERCPSEEEPHKKKVDSPPPWDGSWSRRGRRSREDRASRRLALSPVVEEKKNSLRKLFWAGCCLLGAIYPNTVPCTSNVFDSNVSGLVWPFVVTKQHVPSCVDHTFVSKRHPEYSNSQPGRHCCQRAFPSLAYPVTTTTTTAVVLHVSFYEK